MSLPPHLIAQAAYAAYQPRDYFESFVRAVGGDNPQWVHVSGDVLLSFMRDKRYVIFRGSDSGWDWVGNALRWRVDVEDLGSVHAGFEAGWRGVQDFVPEDGSIWIGHSRGAALATLGALRKGGELHTFGGPRVLGWEAKETLVRKVRFMYRYTLPWDWVPHVPLVGYYHPCPAIRLPYPLRFKHGMQHYMRAIQECAPPAV